MPPKIINVKLILFVLLFEGFFVTSCAGNEVEQEIANLKSTDVNVRMNAAKRLGELQDANAIEPLIEALKKITQKTKHNKIIDVEDCFEWEVEESIQAALVEIGKNNIESMMEQFVDADEDVNYTIAYVLIKIGEKTVLPLIEILKNNDCRDKKVVIYALSRLKDNRAVDVLIEFAKDKNSKVFNEAMIALGEFNDSKAVDFLIQLLKDKNYNLRNWVAMSLGNIGDVRAVEPLIAALNDKVLTVRSAAAFALGCIGDYRAVEPLINQLASDVTFDIVWAMHALGKIGDVRAVNPLINTFKKEFFIPEYAIQALKRIGKDAVDGLIEALKEDNFLVRKYVIYTMGQIGDERAIKPLIYDLQDDNQDIKKFIVEALINIDKDKAFEELCKALRDENIEIQKSAADLLLRINPAKAVKVLIVAYIEAGKKIVVPEDKLKSHIDTVKYLLEHQNSWFLDAIVERGELTVEPLTQILNDESPKIRKLAEELLEKITGKKFRTESETKPKDENGSEDWTWEDDDDFDE